MKTAFFFSILLFIACNPRQQEYRRAEDALDAGREYIQACLKGDFSRAAFYTTGDASNTTILQSTEEQYRRLDKEGRQQLRNASINISEVQELNDSTTAVQYSNSSDKEPHRLMVVKRKNDWQVDLSKK